ncbi:MAG: glycosyltransferase family 39 protein [Caldilineales bacterium]|nr:glycosyltransferase family 39 protein [Caldilineales bacterium]
MSDRLRTFLPFLLAAALFLALALYQLDLPGPNYDEAIEAQPAIRLLLGQPVTAHRQAVVRLAGRELPLMVVDYVGGLNIYALWLFVRLGGIDVATMRLWPVAVGLVILGLTFRLGRWAGGLGVGFAAAILLAVHPSYVFFARQGIYVTNTTIAFSLAILLALLRLVATGQRRWWYLAAFLAGLGLWAKFIMLWPLAATALLALPAWRWREQLGLPVAATFRPRNLFAPSALAGALAAFGLGMAPLLVFNLQTGATIRHFLGTLGRSYYGVANTAYLANLAARVEQLGHFLRGDHFWYLGGHFGDPLAPWVWVGGSLVVLATALTSREVRLRTLAWRGLFAYAFVGLLLLQSPLTPTALWYTHLALFSPFLALSTALAGAVLWERLPLRGRWPAIVLFVLVLGLGSLRADLAYHRSLRSSGGIANHSDAVYRLGDVLLAGGHTRPYALDWGLAAPLVLVTQGRVNPIEVFGYETVETPPPGLAAVLQPLLAQPDAVFLLHAPDRTNFGGRRELFFELAAAQGLQPELLAVARERSGAVYGEVFRLVSR